MKTYSESLSMTLGEPFTRSDYPHASSVIAPSQPIEVVDSLYRYLNLQVLVDQVKDRYEALYFIQEVKFSASDKPFYVESSSAGTGDYSLQYMLVYRDQTLGCITLSRDRNFTKHESRAIALAVKELAGPFNNALLYARACHSAYHDELTGLYNRAALNSSIFSGESEVAYEPLVLLVCDIDQFKLINDNHGHATGDEVLRRFSEKLQSISRVGDIIYRYGGDEFVIAIANATSHDGREFAERVRQSIECGDFAVGDTAIELTTTIGVTGWRENECIEKAFLRADTALLQGKKTGRNKVVWA